MKEENHNLIPYTSFIETEDIHESPFPTPWHPTPEQIRMLTWINIVHGVTGINWFHYRLYTPREDFAVIAELKDHITELTPVILSPGGI